MPENDIDLLLVRQAVTYNNAVKDAYLFYHNDVEPRRVRERNSLLNIIYSTSIPIEKAKIGVGEGQESPNIFEPNNYLWKGEDIRSGYHSGFKGTVIAPKSLNYSREDLALTITHELTHEDLAPNRSFLLGVINAWTGLNGSAGLTHKESNYLKNAYGLPKWHKDQHNETDLKEMHATNRELRMHLLLKFKELYGRDPENIEELDLYINHFSNKELLLLLSEENGYGYYYGSPYIVEKNGAVGQNYEDDNSKAAAVKLALIHVAQNKNSFNEGSDFSYAKKGGSINYLKFFK